MEYSIEELANLYKNQNTSFRKLAKELNVSVDKIRYAAKKMGVHKKQTSANFPEYRKHQIDLHFFDNIDTQEKAYFLGWMFSDGYCSSKGFHLTLQNQDKDILYYFAKCLGKDMSIVKPFGEKYTQLSVVSVYMATQLHNLGVVQCKSKILKRPNISDNLLPHFIRGFFNGNGSIFYDKSTKSFGIQIVTTVDMANFIQDFFQTNVKLRNAIPDGSVVRYGFKGNRQVATKLSLLYEHSLPNLYLERKYKRYTECMELFNFYQEERNKIWTDNLGDYARKSIANACEPTDHRV